MLVSVCSSKTLERKGGKIITIYCFIFDDLWLGGEINFMLSVTVNYFRALELGIFSFGSLKILYFSMMIG